MLLEWSQLERRHFALVRIILFRLVNGIPINLKEKFQKLFKNDTSRHQRIGTETPHDVIQALFVPAPVIKYSLD